MTERIPACTSCAAEKKISLGADVFRLAFLISFFLIVGFFFKDEILETLSLQKTFILLQGMDIPGGLWMHDAFFVVIAGALIVIGIPRLWICGIAGAIYGITIGTALSLASSMIGAFILYLLGRFFLAGMIERRIQTSVTSRLSRTMVYWRDRFRQNSFWWVLYGRLMPITNATVNSLICGCFQVPLRHYLLGSLLGFIPLTLVFTSFGSGGFHGNVSQVLMGFSLLGGAILARFLLNNFLFTSSLSTSSLPLLSDSSPHSSKDTP